MKFVTWLCLSLLITCSAFAQVDHDWQQVTSAGGLMTDGTYESEGFAGSALAGLSSDGTYTLLVGGGRKPIVLVLETDEPEVLVPLNFTLDQNYPNPFNPTTNISFEMAKPGHVSIRIYNVLGQQIKTLVDENLAVGSYTVEWDGRDASGSEMATGIYFYQLDAEHFSDVKKMLLLK